MVRSLTSRAVRCVSPRHPTVPRTWARCPRSGPCATDFRLLYLPMEDDRPPACGTDPRSPRTRRPGELRHEPSADDDPEGEVLTRGIPVSPTRDDRQAGWPGAAEEIRYGGVVGHRAHAVHPPAARDPVGGPGVDVCAGGDGRQVVAQRAGDAVPLVVTRHDGV